MRVGVVGGGAKGDGAVGIDETAGGGAGGETKGEERGAGGPEAPGGSRELG